MGIRMPPHPSLGRLQTLLPSDIAKGFLRGEFPPVLKYSVMEIRHGEDSKMIMRFYPIRKPHKEMIEKAWEEIKRVDLDLEIAEVVEPGTITRVNDLLSINDYVGTGIAVRLLRETLPDSILIGSV
jgi:hypothetical protein